MEQTLSQIFPDFALIRSGMVIYLAVLGYADRLKTFAAWLADATPASSFAVTDFDFEVFGMRKTIVFDVYDCILRIEFPSEAQAMAFAAESGPDLFARSHRA